MDEYFEMEFDDVAQGPCVTVSPGYVIDQEGADGLWRVWWMDAQGCGREMLFGSFQAAQMWVEFNDSL